MEKEPRQEELVISQQLEDAISISARMGTVDVPQLIASILTQEGLGKRSLEVVSRGHLSVADLASSLSNVKKYDEHLGSIVINGQRFSITDRVASILSEAQNQAKDRCVDTGHVIQTELGRLDSVLANALKRMSPSAVPLDAVLSSYIEIARKEKKYTPEQRSNHLVNTEQIPVSGRTVDLIVRAKEGSFKEVFVNREWTLSLIQSITSQPITILMTEHSDEVRIAMQGLALELVSHDGSLINIPKIIEPSASGLIEDPDGVIAEAVREACGGVLLLPDDPRYLMNKAVRMGLEEGKIRVVSFSSEKSWVKNKETLGQVNAHELYLSMPTEAVVLDMLRAQKKFIELGDGTNGSPFRLTVSDKAFREAAKLGYRYASVMNLPSILAARRLIDTAITNLKLAHSGLKRLLPSPVADDSKIDIQDIYIALKTMTGIEMQPEDPKRFLHMEDELRKQIVGQDEAIAIVSDTVRRSETVLRDPKRPRGAFMFLGPSGVGKTELAKSLNDFIFHDDRSFIQLNMSEYQEQHSVARLIGAPPGYVGYEEGGQLTERVRKQPYSIVVIDEIEKANAKVFDVFLQVFEEGVLTDGRGRSVDFSNTILILTGNIGSEFFGDVDSRGFDEVKKDVIRETQRVYRPEFLNRLDNIIVFKPLSPEAISKIVDLQVQKLNNRLQEKGIKIELTAQMRKFLETVGYDPKYGARPLRRATETYIGNKLTSKLLAKEYSAGSTVTVDYTDNEVRFTHKK